jgi:hypothetical protein
MSNLSIKHPSQKQCLDLNTCWQVLNQRVIFVLTELNSDVMSHNFYTLSDPYPNVFHISLCIIQSTLPFQGEIFPVLYNPLLFQKDISCIALYYTIHSIISERYFLYCPVLYNPLYHFREIFAYYPVLYNPLYHFIKIFPVLPCIIQSTLPFQGDISCIALYYTIHSIISGRYFLYYTIHSIISGKYFLTLLYW